MDKQLIFDMLLTIINIILLLAICGVFVYVLRLVVKALRKYIISKSIKEDNKEKQSL